MTAIYDCCYNLSALGDSEWNRRLVAAPALRNVRSARALPPFQKALLISAEQADLLARCRLVATTGCRRLAGSVSARRLRATTSRRDEGDGHGAGEWRGHGAGTRRPGIHALVPPPSRVAHFWLSFRRRCAFPSFLPPALICCDRPPSALEGGGRTKHVLEDPSTD